ncbi:MAG: TonB-dependent receptor [Pseudomonadota bacterium]
MKYAPRAAFSRYAGASVATLALATSVVAQEEDTDRTLGTVLVTTQKVEESIQDVPIAVTAFDESALEKLQLAGGPDLVKAIPNVSFSQTNFGGFNFKIRGIGADVTAQSGDAGVGIHQNDIPLSGARFFEAEFFDVERVEVLRGPQGTLYGRNATGGVTNIITAKPVLEEFQANAQLSYGNYESIRAKGMVNVPIGDSVALRIAGSYLTRDGYATNEATGNDVDDRDLYSVRATLAAEPTDRLRGWISVEHFEEDDTRLRFGRQLCDKDPFDTSFAGIPISAADQTVTSQGCLGGEPVLEGLGQSTNSASTLSGGLAILSGLVNGDVFTLPSSTDLRTGYSQFDPDYQAEQTLFSWNVEYDLTDSLSLTYLGSYFESEIFSANTFGSGEAGVPYNDLSAVPPGFNPAADLYNALFPGGFVTDPQLGTSNLFTSSGSTGSSTENTSHELRLQSDFDGPFNFNLGVIKFDTDEADPDNARNGTYVFSNSITALAQLNNAQFAATGSGIFPGTVSIDQSGNGEPPLFSNVNGVGRNYFRSISPFKLDSFAVFGEGYYDLSDELQLTIGLRYTDDQKTQQQIPSFLLTPDAIRPDPLEPTDTLEADFQETTGRIGLDWSPDLSFTRDTLVYAFYSRGYKGGGLNPPQPEENQGIVGDTFDPEFINSYEIGTKNTLAAPGIGALQLNATGFYYDYEGYQISQIVNRTAANINIDAEIYGFELESIWSPVPSLVFNANLGLLNTEVQDAWAVNTRDRTNGRSDLVVLSNPASGSNCVVSAQGYATVLGAIAAGTPNPATGQPILTPGATAGLCSGQLAGLAPLLGVPDISYTNSQGETVSTGGLTPFSGEAADLSGNSIPGSPDTTLSFGAEYTWSDLGEGAWDLSARADYYYQSDSFARIWNTRTDELDSWDNLNLSLRLTNQDRGFWIEVFGKNVTDEEVITGHSLGDDSAGLTTNIFLTEPATYGVTIAKSW